MRITRVGIGLFGKFRDRDVEFSPGLNVVYGPNETGKSTLRCFITNTLFPNNPVRYPASRTTDSGTIDAVLEDGEKITFTREGKRAGNTAEGICGIGPKEYTDIYSMSPDDLRDTGSIEKGGIRSRFLTIPGGNDLPKAYEDLDRERRAFLPDLKRNSTCVISRRIEASREADLKVKQLRGGSDDGYSELSERKTELEKQLRSADARYSAASAAREDSLRRESYSGTVGKVRALEKRIEELKYSENADDAARDTYVRHKTQTEAAEERLGSAKADLEEKERRLGSIDWKRVISAEDGIGELSHQTGRYEYLNGKKAQGTRHLDDETARKVRMRPLSYLGLAVIAAGLLLTVTDISPYWGAAAMVAGALLFAAIYEHGSKALKKAPVSRPDAETEKELEALEDLWVSTCRKVGIPYASFASDVRRLTDMLTRSLEYRDAAAGLGKAEEDADGERKDLELFLQGFGGEEKFLQAVKDCKEYEKAVAAVDELKDGLPPEAFSAPPEEAERVEEVSVDRDSLLREISRTEQAMKDIAGDTSVEEAITASADAENRVYEAVLEWARLALEKRILDDACSSAYGAHRPSVIEDADGFLSSMTGGRYRMNMDPKETDITVTDTEDGTVKGEREWSTGLGDQVKLSLKMAVSLSLSKERPPVILDDVLLTSDGERKKGAARALRELSESIQVIYFTCDAETRNLLASEGAEVIDL